MNKPWSAWLQGFTTGAALILFLWNLGSALTDGGTFAWFATALWGVLGIAGVVRQVSAAKKPSP